MLALLTLGCHVKNYPFLFNCYFYFVCVFAVHCYTRLNSPFKEQKLESSLSGAAFESKLKAAARKLFSNLGIDDEVK